MKRVIIGAIAILSLGVIGCSNKIAKEDKGKETKETHNIEELVNNKNGKYTEEESIFLIKHYANELNDIHQKMVSDVNYLFEKGSIKEKYDTNEILDIVGEHNNKFNSTLKLDVATIKMAIHADNIDTSNKKLTLYNNYLTEIHKHYMESGYALVRALSNNSDSEFKIFELESQEGLKKYTEIMENL